MFQESFDAGSYQVLAMVFLTAMLLICTYYVSRYLETLYVKMYKKPYFIHFYIPIKKLPSNQKSLLSTNKLYKQLDKKRKTYFEHRTAKFLKTTNFVGRDGLQVDDIMRMKIAMTVIQLTFGMRNYLLNYVNTIILYPSSYFSILNQTENKGEFNPRSKALVLSWEDFEKGNSHKEDGINLGIHEITHAIHYNAIKSNDIGAEIFYDTFLELEKHLGSKEVRDKMIETEIIREYAFTDKFEFVAVVVELFMESPQELKKHFPVIYEYVRQMLNFRYF
ncbi:zinc-dependent peptidase [Aquimarina sp. 2201CG5-10]|uniref:zinc-dependent peptidase n=1 Tax=Aquimarina callyspongiae TaxID=3098150 RepID=UPI002AB5456B|nr:zinc-dependent peptidase [Aquimarina sp. 2201CG5-10]MDY8138835.1 zinc-dependent peptidase [Aquimarina sp. 2201CG5-10]